MTNTITRPAVAPVVQHTPDAIHVAKSILRGVEPSPLYWNLLPSLAADDSGIDVYLRPRSGLGLTGLELATTAPATLGLERSIESDPAYRARMIEHAILDSLAVLNRLSEDGQRNRGQETKNSRLRHRLAAAVHEELESLLSDWNLLTETGLVKLDLNQG